MKHVKNRQEEGCLIPEFAELKHAEWMKGGDKLKKSTVQLIKNVGCSRMCSVAPLRNNRMKCNVVRLET
ncbi:hypothetical protein B9Z55_025151 [Caenorhabditis nigoni]|uniref:Uncharacterized protein n=1 Tax=Caenorhabditis nigoni TaxID=1611254 RepID=A0A2G5SXP6_9PELO|nr:hypothetical protein B9Z55_025151 [Caenorhabditis nigoni]